MLTVYSKKHCSFCDQAKALLKKHSIQFEEKMIDSDDSAREFVLGQGHRTVPQIYKNGQLFVEGGYNGLRRLTENDFQKLLEEQNVNIK